MAQVIWTVPARDDLRRIRDYIALDAPLAAKRLADRIIRRARSLRRNPRIGGWVLEDPSKTYRELLEGNYRYEGKKVYIVTIFHAARLLDVNNLEQ